MKNLLCIFSILIAVIFTSCDPTDVLIDPVDSDTLDYVWDTTNVVKIVFQENSIIAESENVAVLGTKLTILKSGTYELSGSLTDGQVVVNTSGIVRLLMNNVTISNSTTSPIYIQDAKRAIIMLLEGTTNTVSDGANYVVTADSLNSAIYSTDYLAISGEGSLVVNGNYNSAISSRDELIIESGVFDVNSIGPAIKGKDLLIINGGDFTVNSQADGFKSDKDSIATQGYVEINGGTFKITSAKDGISAITELRIKGGVFDITTGGGSEVDRDTTISSKAIKCDYSIDISAGEFVINSSDNSIDAKDHLLISGGNFEISSGNKPFDSDSTMTVTGGEVSILKAVKGISSHKIYLMGGEISILSRNDCLKATLGQDLLTDDGSLITINGANLYLITEKGDALDSNGSIVINSGTIVIQGSSTRTDDALSYRNSFELNGGVLVASGGTSLLPSTTSTQNTVGITFNSFLIPGMCINIQDADANTVVTYRPKKIANFLVVSHENLKLNTTYSVYIGGSETADDYNGYFPESTYTPGVKKGTFTLTTNVKSVTF